MTLETAQNVKLTEMYLNKPMHFDLYSVMSLADPGYNSVTIASICACELVQSKNRSCKLEGVSHSPNSYDFKQAERVL